MQPLDADFAYDHLDADGTRINEEMRGYLRETGCWTMVLAVLAYILVAILGFGYVLILSMKRGAMDEGESSGYQIGEMIGTIFGAALIIGIGYRFAMSLHNFTKNFRKAERANSQDALEFAFVNLERVYRMAGWIFAIYFLIILYYILAVNSMDFSNLH